MGMFILLADWDGLINGGIRGAVIGGAIGAVVGVANWIAIRMRKSKEKDKLDDDRPRRGRDDDDDDRPGRRGSRRDDDDGDDLPRPLLRKKKEKEPFLSLALVLTLFVVVQLGIVGTIVVMVVQTNQRGIAPGEDELLERVGGGNPHEDMVLETDFVMVRLDDNDSATTTEVKALKGQVNGMSMTTAGVSVAALRGKNLVRITTSKGAKAGDHEFDVSGSGGKKITMKLSIRKEIDEPGAPDLVLEKNLIELAVLDEEVDSIVKIQGKAAAAQTSVKGLSVDLKEPGQIRVRAARDVSPGEHAIDVRGSAGNVVKLRVKIKPADLVLENDLLELRLRAGGPVEGIVKVKGKVASAHPPLAGLSVDVQHEGEIRVAARRDTQPGDWVMDVRGMAGNTVKLKLKILRDTLVLEKDVVDLRVPWDGQAEQIVNVKTGQVVAAQPLVKGITVDIKDDKSIRVAAGKNSPTGDWAFDILGAAGDRAKLKVRIQRENALELDRESLELR